MRWRQDTGLASTYLKSGDILSVLYICSRLLDAWRASVDQRCAGVLWWVSDEFPGCWLSAQSAMRCRFRRLLPVRQSAILYDRTLDI